MVRSNLRLAHPADRGTLWGIWRLPGNGSVTLDARYLSFSLPPPLLDGGPEGLDVFVRRIDPLDFGQRLVCRV